MNIPPQFQNKGEKPSRERKNKQLMKLNRYSKQKSLKTSKINIDVPYPIS